MADSMKISEVAAEMNVSYQSARRALLDAGVPFHTIGKTYYINRIDFDLFRASRIGYSGRGRPKKMDQREVVDVPKRLALSQEVKRLAEIHGLAESVLATMILHEAAHLVAASLLEGRIVVPDIEMAGANNTKYIMEIKHLKEEDWNRSDTEEEDS